MHRIFATGLILLIFILTALNYYRAVNYRHFSLEYNRGIVIIYPKGTYLTWQGRDDVIDDAVERSYKPFEIDTKTTFSSSGIDFAWLSEGYTEEIIQGNNKRLTTLARPTGNTLEIQTRINTNYSPSPGLKYIAQLSYSGITNFTQDANYVVFKDYSCETKIAKQPGIVYQSYNNGRALRIIRDYQTELTLNIQLTIDCY